MPGLNETTKNRWLGLVATDKMERDKAELSLVALPHRRNAIRVRTIADALKAETPTLATVVKYHGPELAEESVLEFIAGALSLIAVGKSISPVAFQSVAKMVVDQYPWLTLADLKMAFKSGISGNYGELYDKFDGPTVFKWLNAYVEERLEFAEIESEKAHSLEKQNWREWQQTAARLKQTSQ